MPHICQNIRNSKSTYSHLDDSWEHLALLLLVLQNTVPRGSRDGFDGSGSLGALSVVTATPLKLNPPFLTSWLENGRTWENQPLPRKSPPKWTLPSLAFYNAPSLHIVDPRSPTLGGGRVVVRGCIARATCCPTLHSPLPNPSFQPLSNGSWMSRVRRPWRYFIGTPSDTSAIWTVSRQTPS